MTSDDTQPDLAGRIGVALFAKYAIGYDQKRNEVVQVISPDGLAAMVAVIRGVLDAHLSRDAAKRLTPTELGDRYEIICRAYKSLDEAHEKAEAEIERLKTAARAGHHQIIYAVAKVEKNDDLRAMLHRIAKRLGNVVPREFLWAVVPREFLWADVDTVEWNPTTNPSDDVQRVVDDYRRAIAGTDDDPERTKS